MSERQHSLPPPPGGPRARQAPSSPPHPSRARRLSRRKVKALVRIGQVWRAPDGQSWQVSQVWRKDGLVSLLRPTLGGAEKRSLTFGELGRYVLVEGGG